MANATFPINFCHPVMHSKSMDLQTTAAAAAAAAEAVATSAEVVAVSAIIMRQTYKFMQRINESYEKETMHVIYY